MLILYYDRKYTIKKREKYYEKGQVSSEGGNTGRF